VREADFQTKFTRWAKHNLITRTGAYELKLTKTKSLPFNAVAPHQIIALQLVKHNHLGYKIPDVGLSQKPFDFFNISSSQSPDAQIVVMFYTRGNNKFYMIDVDDFVNKAKSSERKSLTEDECSTIACRVGYLL